MSSWKKASKAGQKFHKERGQLRERENLGLLEKKKDYKLRAIDFQQKRDVIINLKRKVLEKNPDEFYFNMTRTNLKDGVHQLRQSTKDYTEDELKLMKSQDKNYIRLHYLMELKKVNKLKESSHLIDVKDAPSNKHTFFVDDFKQGVEFNPAKQLNTVDSLLNRKSNRLTKEQLENVELPTWIDQEFLKEMSKTRAKKYKEIAERTKRFKSLQKLEQNYELKPTKEEPEDEYDSKFNLDTSNNNAQVKPVDKKIIPRKR